MLLWVRERIESTQGAVRSRLIAVTTTCIQLTNYPSELPPPVLPRLPTHPVPRTMEEAQRKADEMLAELQAGSGAEEKAERMEAAVEYLAGLPPDVRATVLPDALPRLLELQADSTFLVRKNSVELFYRLGSTIKNRDAPALIASALAAIIRACPPMPLPPSSSSAPSPAAAAALTPLPTRLSPAAVASTKAVKHAISAAAALVKGAFAAVTPVTGESQPWSEAWEQVSALVPLIRDMLPGQYADSVRVHAVGFVEMIVLLGRAGGKTAASAAGGSGSGGNGSSGQNGSSASDGAARDGADGKDMANGVLQLPDPDSDPWLKAHSLASLSALTSLLQPPAVASLSPPLLLTLTSSLTGIARRCPALYSHIVPALVAIVPPTATSAASAPVAVASGEESGGGVVQQLLQASGKAWRAGGAACHVAAHAARSRRDEVPSSPVGPPAAPLSPRLAAYLSVPRTPVALVPLSPPQLAAAQQAAVCRVVAGGFRAVLLGEAGLWVALLVGMVRGAEEEEQQQQLLDALLNYLLADYNRVKGSQVVLSVLYALALDHSSPPPSSSSSDVPALPAPPVTTSSSASAQDSSAAAGAAVGAAAGAAAAAGDAIQVDGRGQAGATVAGASTAGTATPATIPAGGAKDLASSQIPPLYTSFFSRVLKSLISPSSAAAAAAPGGLKSLLLPLFVEAPFLPPSLLNLLGQACGLEGLGRKEGEGGIGRATGIGVGRKRRLEERGDGDEGENARDVDGGGKGEGREGEAGEGRERGDGAEGGEAENEPEGPRSEEELKRVKESLVVLWRLLVLRPPVRRRCLAMALQCAVHPHADIRSKGVALVANRLHALPYLTVPIERYALKQLLSLPGMALPAPAGATLTGEQQKAVGHEVERRLALFCALCSRRPSLLADFFRVFAQVNPVAKRVMLRDLLPLMLAALPSTTPDLLTLISNPPEGSMRLLLKMDQVPVLFISCSCSIRLSAPPVPSYLINITIPNSWQALEVFPRLLHLPLELFKIAQDRLLQGSPHTPPLLTAVELMTTLHAVQPKRDNVPLKKIMAVCSFCISQRAIYTQQVIAKVLNQLVGQTPLPMLLFRTAMEAVAAFPDIASFVADILSRLITKQVWRAHPQLWLGFIKCCLVTKPLSFPVLLQLPAAQLEDALNREPSLRPDLAAHAAQPSVQPSVPRASLVLLGVITQDLGDAPAAGASAIATA
ncbi:unnamed protein product [Closterium sp. Yama58-4]|nr:unnamed protein product [Closterium sp. Yama58-4]